MQSSQLRVGIPVVGSKNWVAGTIYCHNLQAACLRCRHGTPLQITLIAPGFRPSATKLAQRHSNSTVAYFSHREGQSESLVRRLGKIAISQVRHPGCRSLERVIQEREIDAVFPGVRNDKTKRWSCPQIFWVPDFQHCHLPEFFPGSQLRSRDASLRAIFECADRVILSSRAAYADACHFYPEYRSSFRVLPFVIVPHPSWFTHTSSGEVCRQFGIDRPYLIFPSQFWMHKNHSLVFESLRLLKAWKPDLLLVCTGRQHDYRNPDYARQLMNDAEKMDLQDNLILTGLLPRADQVQLMRQAKAIIQPSLFEGWSALLEDARMLGKSVFVSDLPIHREQNPPDAFFFPPHDAKALADLIRANWDHLPDRCDPKTEEVAIARQLDRGTDFIQGFFAIVHEFLQHHTPERYQP